MAKRAPPPMPGEDTHAKRMEEMIRVDHAGEFGAVQIYRGQRAVFDAIPGKSHIAAQIAEMEAGEQEHLRSFDALVMQRGVRPTLMAPLWRLAGFGLGAATALMGEKAAYACTEAVEEVIEEHYSAQSRALGEDEAEFKGMIDKFRADEVAHKDLAIEEGAREAPGYGLLSAAIKFGCRTAIRISEKI
jgi:ubiquinone biosynthesis monooxygenase Coq7